MCLPQIELETPTPSASDDALGVASAPTSSPRHQGGISSAEHLVVLIHEADLRRRRQVVRSVQNGSATVDERVGTEDSNQGTSAK